MKKFDHEAFKAKLEAQSSFPSLYMFKFIVPNGKEHEVKALLPYNQMELKASSKGNYVSVTIKAMMPSSDAIIDIYDKASVIEGVIAL
jgi:putative lipoic acid-binding regulatory protein